MQQSKNFIQTLPKFHGYRAKMLENTIKLLVGGNREQQASKLRSLKRNEISKKVTMARQGVEALDYLFRMCTYSTSDRGLMRQLIVSDLKLPKIDGVQVLRCLRSGDRAKQMPAAILTSSKEELNPNDTYNSACNSYIRKKLNFIQLNKAVNNLGLYWLNLNQQPSKTRRN